MDIRPSRWVKVGTAAEWAVAEPLRENRLGLATDTGEFKVGDGETAFADLPAVPGGGGGGGQGILFDDVNSGASLRVTTTDAGVEITDESDYGIYITNTGGGDVEFNAGGNPNAAVRVQSNATGKLAFFGHPGVVRPNNVPVTAADIHAALVSLGLITS